ncbi:MAG: hypothetical protein HY270_01450 [Deltaproteobacteria bacterium]|nr:hypothetical protein [Deltaproteobacteria bacterium]
MHAMHPLVGKPSAATPRSLLIFTIVLAMSLAAAWIWQQAATERALMSLPETERHFLYERTLKNFQTLCSQRGPQEECRHQAEFLRQFPDCNAACENALAATQHNAPR